MIVYYNNEIKDYEVFLDEDDHAYTEDFSKIYRTNKSCLTKMEEIFAPHKVDWMGETKTKKNPFSYHHIIPVKPIVYNGSIIVGTTSIDNGAILTVRNHLYLHFLERFNNISFLELNILFQALNDTKCPPTHHHYEEVNKVLRKALPKPKNLR